MTRRRETQRGDRGAARAEIGVCWYAGYRGDETPRRLRRAGQWIDVGEVLDRWCTPHGRGFRLRGEDGVVYTLQLDFEQGRWEFTEIAGVRHAPDRPLSEER